MILGTSLSAGGSREHARDNRPCHAIRYRNALAYLGAELGCGALRYRRRIFIQRHRRGGAAWRVEAGGEPAGASGRGAASAGCFKARSPASFDGAFHVLVIRGSFHTMQASSPATARWQSRTYVALVFLAC
jgi:hypothetical protein